MAKLWDNIIHKEPITTGWSEDKKYCITVNDGRKYLLRITQIERYETRKALFGMLEQVAALDIPMCLPIEFDTCEDGVYSIQSWIDGEDLEAVLPFFSETEQYVLGLKSGEIVRKMHTIPAPDTQDDWYERYNKKIDNRIKANQECVEQGLVINGMGYLRDYVENNRHLLRARPQCFQHGDYHVGNMMMRSGELIIIDFDRFDFGDPWEEFNRITFSAAASPHFATGQLCGYFGGEPPLEFFKLLAFYIAGNFLGGLSWARMFGEKEKEFSKKQIADILSWYNNMNSVEPTWYLKDFCS
jgi:serine/threonine-protein kinase